MVRQTLEVIVSMREAAGVTLDVQPGKRHWRILARLGDRQEQLCVLGFSHSSKTFQSRGRHAKNMLADARRKLAEMQSAAAAS